MKKVAEVVELYRKLARIPQPSWARISKSLGSCAVVNSVWTYRDLERADKVQFAKTYCANKTSEAKYEVTFTSRPQELANEQWNVESPSGNLRAIVRKITGKKNEEKQFVEIWNGSQKLQNIDVLSLEKHGKIYDNDGYFGSVEWSHSEGHLLYVAELKYPKAISFFEKKHADVKEDETKKDETKEKGVKGEEYVMKEEWGEGMVGKHHPVICILDVDTGDIRILDNVPDHVSPGHVVWAPDDSGVVFTGWCHEPYRLGVIYCINRQSAVYYLDFQKATCEALTDPDGAARCPVFSPDDSSFVFLQSNRKGPHNHCSCLCKYDWQKKESTVVCDIVGTPKQNGFPGVYEVTIPRDCWSTDNKRIVIGSLWRSQAVILVINTETKAVIRLPSDCGGDISVCHVWNDVIIATCSAPNQPHYLVIGQLPAEGQEFNIQWSPLDSPSALFGDILWKILVHRPTKERIHPKYDTLDYESVFIKPSNAEQSSRSLVVFPHGGPHSVFTTEFMLYAALFCQSGFSVLMVNYRGSVGFGNDSVFSLLGNVGDQDVKDVQAAAEEVISKEDIDPNKVVIWGGSHGGFLTAHLIGQYPSFYKAAVCRNPVINIASMSGSTDICDWNFTECGLEFEYKSLADGNSMSIMWSKSPLQYVDKIQTPVMLMIGLDDRRVPPKQSYELYKALKARKVPVRYIAYPDNGHPIVKVDSEADAFINIYKWFTDYLPQ
ncbi:hypothetical protein CHS0354_029939 [Potamilus streckersoni]|uniref:Acylamino-acid-releasing enzyme n=1 Tax=Potamilus streckersoni TaxID=2493646 RepID=A0AAE0RT38_9BIVA|nr:hypothetical protein CHS0354_029939 [Potamilus streckersoni]